MFPSTKPKTVRGRVSKKLAWQTQFHRRPATGGDKTTSCEGSGPKCGFGGSLCCSFRGSSGSRGSWVLSVVSRVMNHWLTNRMSYSMEMSTNAWRVTVLYCRSVMPLMWNLCWGLRVGEM